MIGVGLGLGAAASGAAPPDAFPYSLSDLGTLGGAESAVTALNAYGAAGGYAQLDGGAYHAFIASAGERSDLGTLGGANSYLYALNNAGQAAGWSQTAAPGGRSSLSPVLQLIDPERLDPGALLRREDPGPTRPVNEPGGG